MIKRNSFINIKEHDNRIQSREQYNNAKSDVTRSEIFGDVWKNQYKITAASRQPWLCPGRAIQTPDFESLYDKYTNFDR